MSEEILLQPSFDKLTKKLDNTQEYEDWLLIQEYIDRIRKENKHLKQRLYFLATDNFNLARTLNDIRTIINNKKQPFNWDYPDTNFWLNHDEIMGILRIIGKALREDDK